jgi:hypothetical protein
MIDGDTPNLCGTTLNQFVMPAQGHEQK